MLRIITQFNGVNKKTVHLLDKAKNNILYFTVGELVSWSS